MGTVLTIRAVCERSLRKIGAYSINDSAAEGAHLEEAASWLDMLIGHLSGTQRALWFIPKTARLPLIANQQEYDLNSSLIPVPTRGVQFPIRARLYSTASATEIGDLALLRRVEYDEIANKLATGAPASVYIDRLSINNKLYPWPVPTDGTYEIRLTFETFSDKLNNEPLENTKLALPEAWNLWAVIALAAQIGNGPVRKLPEDEVDDMQDEAAKLLMDLEPYSNQEHADEPRLVNYVDF